MNYLRETLTFDQAGIVTESANDGKDLYMKGICIQGGVKNANERVYPVTEISNAVKQLNDQVSTGNSVLGEVDHPDDLRRNHVIKNIDSIKSQLFSEIYPYPKKTEPVL